MSSGFRNTALYLMAACKKQFATDGLDPLDGKGVILPTRMDVFEKRIK